MSNYDPELPAGFQDADIEMGDLVAAGNRSAELKKQGLCDHGWLQGTPGAAGPVTCNDCSQVFKTFQDAYAARERVLN